MSSDANSRALTDLLYVKYSAQNRNIFWCQWLMPTWVTFPLGCQISLNTMAASSWERFDQFSSISENWWQHFSWFFWILVFLNLRKSMYMYVLLVYYDLKHFNQWDKIIDNYPLYETLWEKEPTISLPLWHSETLYP